jgi:hypothetical protein
MLRRCRRLLGPEKLRAGIDPSKRICAVRILKRIERLDGRNLFSYDVAHGFCWYP